MFENNKFKNIFWFTAFLVLCSCSATINKSNDLDKNISQYIALLPPNALEGISRERAELINELVRYELESKGYILLNNEIISKFCTDSLCADRSNLKESYNIDNVAMLNLESSSENDFLVGYYNSLSGKFIIENAIGKQLYSASNTYRDSGGLILQSGQVIQAIINQYKNGDQDSMDKVSSNFIYSLLKELPEVKNRLSNAPNDKLLISNLQVTPYNKFATKICIEGKPGHFAWIINQQNNRAELKEIQSGQYCGAFRLEGPWALSNNLKVELKSPFGNTIYAEVKRK